MNINCTIIIQMIHFGIAYAILKRFLFKPTVSVLNSQAEYEQTLHKTIQDQNNTLQIQKYDIAQAWSLFYARETAELPGLSKQPIAQEFPVIHTSSVKLDKQLEQEVAHACLEKVAHVRW